MNEIFKINLLATIKNEICRARHPMARRLPTFYPSSGSVKLENGKVEGGCWQADWYRVNGVVPTDPPEFYISMIHLLGKAIENILVNAMKEAGVYESSGVKFYDPEINVSGELDVVGRFRTKTDSRVRYYLVEAKSVYSQGAVETITGRSRAWKGQAAFRPKPKTQNLLQVMTYLDQFSEARGERFFLEGAKLLYIPRDKPNDGREYTVILVTKETVPQGNMDGADFTSYKAAMQPGKRYAFISTADFPDYVDTRFCLEDMYDRWREQKRLFTEKTAPGRPFKKCYDAEEIEALYLTEDISKSAYEDWQKGRETPGHYLCKSYCEYRSFCYTRQGTPRKEADELVQVKESASAANE